MKIAYLILAHKDPKHLVRLVNRLSKTGDSFIHIDAKVDIKEFENELSSIKGTYIEKNRIMVSWGGWSIVRAYMLLLKKALESEENYDRIVLMTGQDYPLMSDKEILREFEENFTVEYVMAYKIKNSPIPSDKDKIEKKWFFDCNFKNQFLAKAYRRIMYECITKPFRKKAKTIRLEGNEADFYFGQMLSAFTQDAAKLILKTYLENKEFNNVMKYVHAPDELYWQTIIFNSRFRANTIENGNEHIPSRNMGFAPLHYHNYDDKVVVYKEQDFEELKNCGYMFFKKAETGISDGLLDKIDEIRKEK